MDAPNSTCNKCGGTERYANTMEHGLLFCAKCDQWLAPECFEVAQPASTNIPDDIMKAAEAQTIALPLRKWHEDMGFVTWWKFPVSEPSWIGSPLDSDWPGYHTHFTPHPPIPFPELSNKQKRRQEKSR